ncbi:LutB/LldF family L-lactate oxidation iron-sulfur protein [soil metagenome]
MTTLVLKETPFMNQPLPGTNWPERATAAANQHNRALNQAATQFSNLEMARERAAFTRWKTIEHLDKYLIEFESNFIRSGGKVIWAQDISDALIEILSILKKAGVKQVLKSKTQTAEEIGLYTKLSQEGFDAIETDTGDFIIREAGEQASHMILPALHKPVKEIAALLEEKLQLPKDAQPAEMVEQIRRHLREDFLRAGAGITGANFLLADPGAVVILENEGNAQLTASLPKIHIVIAGIEKLLPSLTDLDLFLPLLSTYGTGQQIATYNSIITGPKQAEELDGPEELYVILLDNGRSSVLEHEVQRQAMSCIKCGACQFACPVFRAAGPEKFPSPIAAVTAPLQGDRDAGMHLTQSSTLCGSCKEVCPVKIDLPRLLLQNRKLFVDEGLNSRNEKWFYFFWKKAMLKRDIMNWKGIRAGKYIMENLYKSRDGLRQMPGVAPKSFNEQWREKMNYR